MPEKPSIDPLQKVDPVPSQASPSTVHDTHHSTGPTVPHLAGTPADSPSIPDYRITAEIAIGGMGRIFAAHDLRLDREVAIKTLLPGVSTKRFVTEARIAARLPHPGIPPVHELGTLPDGTPYLVMKLIHGRTLAELLKERPSPLHELARFLQIFEQVAQAVGFAHAQGVVHRDLKPPNVMVGAFGEVQVMDWGLAKVLSEHGQEASGEESQAAAESSLVRSTGPITHTGMALGTPGYMAPEQARGEGIDARADVFALGATLADILTGQPAFVGMSTQEVLDRASRADLADVQRRLRTSGADGELIALALSCLSADPAERPLDGRAVAALVAAYRAGVAARLKRAETERAEALVREGEQRQRRRTVQAAGGIIAIVLLAGLSVSLWQMSRAIDAEGRAKQANADLAARNTDLVDEQAKVEARFETALKAIAAFYTGVSQDALLRNEEFTELRTRLLKEAASFYEELERLLERQTDANSRQMLATAYFQLGDLTEKIGARPQALAVQRKALTVRRELAAAPGAGAETRLNVAQSLRAVGRLLYLTGDPAGALAAWKDQRDIAAAVQAESPMDAARALIAQGYYSSGHVLSKMGKPADALAAEIKGREIRQQLADANPGVAQFQSDLGDSYYVIGTLLKEGGKPKEALEAFQKGLDIFQPLADGNRANTAFQLSLANCYGEIGSLGKPAEGLETLKKALVIRQTMVERHPAVTEYQRNLAKSFNDIGYRLRQTGKLAEALAYYKKALAIQQKLADTHPRDPHYHGDLANSVASLGAFERTDGHPASAAAFFRQAIGILVRLPTRNPVDRYNLACCNAMLAGVAADRGSGLTAADATAAADKAMAALRDAVAAGYRDVASMKSDPDLAVLRPRADFQQLMKELEPKKP
jgi:tetratricopeptide (TPR) repeat protein/tRNA A-37 threonylcarbamoyl transferase component Bud32